MYTISIAKIPPCTVGPKSSGRDRARNKGTHWECCCSVSCYILYLTLLKTKFSLPLHLWYADDGSLVFPVRQTMAVIFLIQSQCQCRGLDLNLSKTAIWWPTVTSSILRTLPCNVLWDNDLQPHAGITVFGTAIGTPQHESAPPRLRNIKSLFHVIQYRSHPPSSSLIPPASLLRIPSMCHLHTALSTSPTASSGRLAV